MSGQQSSFFESMKLRPQPNSVVSSQLTKVLETQMRGQSLCQMQLYFLSIDILGLMFLRRHLNKRGGFDLKALWGDGER